MWQSSTIVTFRYFVSSFYSGNCYSSKVQIRCRIAHILVTDCARTARIADTQISMYIFYEKSNCKLFEFPPSPKWISGFLSGSKMFIRMYWIVRSANINGNVFLWCLTKNIFLMEFHGKFGCFEMEKQQNRWHSSIVTSYSPEWFLVKDLCTWYKSEAHSCRPNRGLFTLIKFGIAALPLRTWQHYHFFASMFSFLHTLEHFENLN